MTSILIREKRGRFDSQKYTEKFMCRRRQKLERGSHKPGDAQSHEKLKEAGRLLP